MRELNKLTPLEIFLLIASLVITALAVWGLLNKVDEFEIQAKESQTIIEKSAKADKPIIAVNYKKPYYDIPLEEQYQDYVFKMCNKYKVPVNIVLGIMWQESRYDFMALSQSRSCVGIMQINRINYDELNEQIGITDLTDPHQNIESGIYIFSKLLHKYGDYHKALVCYNCGETGAKNIISSKYAVDVMDYALSLKV